MHTDRFHSTLAKYQSQIVPPKNQYISCPHQLRALQLSSKFADQEHKILYLNLCKNIHPAIIDQAESFVSDANAQNKGALFMWKVKQIKTEWEKTSKNWHNPDKVKTQPKKKKAVSKSKPVVALPLFEDYFSA